MVNFRYISTGLISAVMLVSFACSTQRSYQSHINPSDLVIEKFSLKEVLDALEIATKFWKAAYEYDTAAIVEISINNDPIEWISGQRLAYPAYFDSTYGRIKFEDMYSRRSVPDTVILKVEVPWVVCKPPYHSGLPDLLYFYLMRHEDPNLGWRLIRIGRDPC